jgi:hypothetical protein
VTCSCHANPTSRRRRRFVGSSLLLSAPWKFQEPKTIGSGSMHHPFMHVWCEIGVAVVERMDYLFCTVFAWKLTNKKFETVAI